MCSPPTSVALPGVHSPQTGGMPDSSHFPVAFRPRNFLPFQQADRHQGRARQSAGNRAYLQPQPPASRSKDQPMKTLPFAAFGLALLCQQAAAQDASDLAKKLSNPVAD